MVSENTFWEKYPGNYYTCVARVPRFTVAGCEVGTMYCDVGEFGSLATCGTAPFLVAAEYGGGAGVPMACVGAGGNDVLEFRRYGFPYTAE